MRRTEMFSGAATSGQTSSRPLPLVAARQPLPGPDESLPNSPTSFAELQKLQLERDETPSPGTKILNQNFQEHLDQLDQKTQKPKSKVLDWMQEDVRARAGMETKKKEGSKKVEEGKSRSGPTKGMKLDHAANAPARPYKKQTPIYARLHDPDSPDNDPFSAIPPSKESSDEPDLLTAIQAKVKIQPTTMTTTSVPATNTIPSHTHLAVSRTQSTPMGGMNRLPTHPASSGPSGAAGSGFLRPGIGGISTQAQRDQMDSRPRLQTDSIVHRHSARYYPQQRPASGSRVRTPADNQRLWVGNQQKRPGSSTQIRSGSTSSQGRVTTGQSNLVMRSSSTSYPNTASRPPIPGQSVRPGQPASGHAPSMTQTSNPTSHPPPGQVTARFGKDYYILDV